MGSVSATMTTAVPVREIWRFFTGQEIPIRLTGARGVHLLAKRRPDGALAVLVNNMHETTAGPFDVFVSGKPRSVTLKGYGYGVAVER